MKTHEGVLVAGVSPDSPAAKVGFKAGDVIVEFAGKAVASPQELQGLVEQSPIGKEQTVVVLRDGKRVELKVSPTEMAGEAVALPATMPPTARRWRNWAWRRKTSRPIWRPNSRSRRSKASW